MMRIQATMFPHVFLLAMTSAAAFGQFSRGVNLSGAEFGETHLPGVFDRDFTYNSEASFRYFASRGLTLIRVPIRWERIQPEPGGPLDAAHLEALKRNIEWARAYGARVVIDIHNYGRYKIDEGGLKEYVIDNRYGRVIKISGADLADLWVRLSTEFKFEPAVYAYDLMNEPHDMGTADWKAISQAVLTAIRKNRDEKLIMVPGDAWSSADVWPRVHGPRGWIEDPVHNFAYEAHEYFDRDNSGTYTGPYQEDLAVLARTRLAHFVDWCRENGVRGYLGEYGVPNNDPRWLAVLDNFLSDLDAAGFDGTYWAAGEWWGDYPLSVQPRANFTFDRPQTAILLKHLGGGAFTTGSAAPDAIVSGYGAALATIADAAGGLPLPLSLAGVEVEVTDARGAKAVAPLLYASPTQINYVIPAATALGRAGVLVRRARVVVARGTLQVESVAPVLFAATLVRSGDNVFLQVYGSGFRHAATVTLEAGGVPLPIIFAGAQPEFTGLDQVNAQLSGASEVTVMLTADGKTSNAVTVTEAR